MAIATVKLFMRWVVEILHPLSWNTDRIVIDLLIYTTTAEAIGRGLAVWRGRVAAPPVAEEQAGPVP